MIIIYKICSPVRHTSGVEELRYAGQLPKELLVVV